MTPLQPDTAPMIRVDTLGEELARIIGELEASARERPELHQGLTEAADEIRRLRTKLLGSRR